MSKESFAWDPKKNAENLRKHGVSFFEAQPEFSAPKSVIARDVTHALCGKIGSTALVRYLVVF